MAERNWSRGLLIFGIALYWAIAAAFAFGAYQAGEAYAVVAPRGTVPPDIAWRSASGTLFQFGIAFAILFVLIAFMRWVIGLGRHIP